MAETGKKRVVDTINHDHLVPEYSFDLDGPGIAGNAADTAMMMGRDGKWLAGEHLVCYATGRKDRQPPKFPGVRGNLRGVSEKVDSE